MSKKNQEQLEEYSPHWTPEYYNAWNNGYEQGRKSVLETRAFNVGDLNEKFYAGVERGKEMAQEARVISESAYDRGVTTGRHGLINELKKAFHTITEVIE